MKIITIDFETYYDAQYSLDKLSCEEYVNSPRFEVIGAAIKIDGGDTAWYTGGEVDKALGGIDFSDVAILAHNTIFDGAVLAWKYGVCPQLWLDTLSMSRVEHSGGGSLAALATHYNIGAKGTTVAEARGKRLIDFTTAELAEYGRYCINDVELTYKIFKLLNADWFAVSQALYIDIILRMFIAPTIKLDMPLLTKLLADINDEHEQVLRPLYKLGFNKTSATKMLRSDASFAKVLTYYGVEPPTKISGTTGKTAFAFAKTDLPLTDLLLSDSEVVRDMVRARLRIKTSISKNRTQRLLDVGKRNDKLPIKLNFAGARTFRLSGGDGINLQNLPTSSGIRHALIAPEGHTLVVADSSQIEPRLLAYIAGQNDLLELFAQGRDVYCEFASSIYNRTITKVDAQERFIAKVCVLSLGYCTGANKLRHTLALGEKAEAVHISEDEAQHYVTTYRHRYSQIPGLWKRCERVLLDMCAERKGQLAPPLLSYTSAGIVLPNQFRLTYPQLRQCHGNFEYTPARRGKQATATSTNIYGGKVAENLIQALAGIVIAEQIIEIGARYQIAFAVHDEVIIVCRDEEVPNAEAFISNIMSTSPKWAPTLPLTCEVGHGKTYGNAK